MKDKKKVILGLLKMRVKSDDEFEKQIMELAIKKLENIRNDGWGVYYSKGGKRLVAVKKTLEGVYTVKEDTEEICDNAFWGCPFLTNVAIPASVTTVAPYAFAGCEKLKKVTFLGVVKDLARTAFSDDFELTTINVPAGAEKKFRKQLHLTSESETLVLSI